MRWDESGYLEFDKKSDALTTPLFGENDITKELFQIAWQNGINDDDLLGEKGSMKPLYKYNATASESTIYIWAHGNTMPNVIAAGNQSKTPAQTLDFLIMLGMKLEHAGTIAVWSCWSGAPNGFCHALAIACYQRGYRSLTVAGPRLVTGSLIKGYPRVVGKTPKQGEVCHEVNGEKRQTVKDDLTTFTTDQQLN